MSCSVSHVLYGFLYFQQLQQQQQQQQQSQPAAAPSQLPQPQAAQPGQQTVTKQLPSTTPQLPAQKLTTTTQLNSSSAAVSCIIQFMWCLLLIHVLLFLVWRNVNDQLRLFCQCTPSRNNT